jgi:peptide/nickel transport system substrate-binding protein
MPSHATRDSSKCRGVSMEGKVADKPTSESETTRVRSVASTTRSATRRRFLKGVGVTVVGFGAAGLLEACTPSTSPSATGTAAVASASPAKKRGGSAVEGGIGDMASFNPLISNSGVSAVITRALFEPMIDVDLDSTLIPALAEAVPNPADGKTFAFRLKKDLKWSDGQPLTSADVAFTFSLIMDDKYKDFATRQRGQATGQVASVTVTDPLNVVITTKTINASFLANLGTLPILPKHVLESLSAKDLQTSEFNNAPSVASGVFKFDKWTKGQEIRLTRNDNYHRGPALLDTFIRKVLPDETQVATGVRLGEIDIGRVPPAQVDSMKSVQNVSLIQYTNRAWYFYATMMDPAYPAGKLFADKAVRQAMRWAIDVDKMNKVAFLGVGEVMTTHEPSWNWAHDKNPSIKYSYNPDKAKQLLDAAGWRAGSGGVREKNGVALSFEMSAGTGNPILESVVQILQEAWKAIGLDPTIKLKNPTQNVSDVVDKRAFDVWVSTIAGGQDPDEIAQYYESSGAVLGSVNLAMYRNPQIDKLFADARATLDQGKRKETYREIQNVLLEDLPLVPLVMPLSVLGVNKRVNGMEKYALFADAGNRPFMKDVWVSDGK